MIENVTVLTSLKLTACLVSAYIKSVSPTNGFKVMRLALVGVDAASDLSPTIHAPTSRVCLSCIRFNVPGWITA